MKRSVYSLMLTDEVVEAIDRLAYSMNTSRSNLINQILAERVCYETPERRMRDVFSRMEQLLDSDATFQLAEQASDAMMTVKTALHYKYRPTVRYSVELFRDGSGEIRVSYRTKSESFAGMMEDFFSFWNQLERSLCKERRIGREECRREDGKYILPFKNPPESAVTSEEMGQALSEYISGLDRVLKAYVEAPPGEEKESAERIYDSLSWNRETLK